MNKSIMKGIDGSEVIEGSGLRDWDLASIPVQVEPKARCTANSYRAASQTQRVWLFSNKTKHIHTDPEIEKDPENG